MYPSAHAGTAELGFNGSRLSRFALGRDDSPVMPEKPMPEPSAMSSETAPSAPVDLAALVAESDLGGRHPAGFFGALLTGIAIAWSLFQLWYASPLPFTLGVGVFN